MDIQDKGAADLFCLNGKVALVTGAATGIGQAIACALAEAGANISLIEHSSSMNETVKSIKSRGRSVAVVKGSLGSTGELAHFVESTISEYGRLDILVNNAGIARRAPLVDFTEDDWDSVMNVNLKSPFFLSQAAVRYWLAENRPGKIINIASMLSYSGGLYVHSYTASKSAILGITRSMANEVAEKGINVNAIAPGWIITEITTKIRSDSKRNKSILDRLPVNRWGVPDDLKGAAIFLASKASDYMHGNVICIDGGWMAK